MDTISVTFSIPAWVQEGIASGSLERHGSIIRKAIGKKSVRFWLRTAEGILPEAGSSSIPPQAMDMLKQLGTSTNAIAGLQIVNIAASVASTIIVMHKLNKLERKLDEILAELKTLSRDIGWTREMLDGDLFARMRAAARKLSLPLFANDQHSLRLILSELIDVGEMLHARRDLILGRGEAYSEAELFGVYSQNLELCLQLQLGVAWRVGSAAEAATLARDWSTRLDFAIEQLKAPAEQSLTNMSYMGQLVSAGESGRAVTVQNVRALRSVSARVAEQTVLLEACAQAGLTPGDLDDLDAKHAGKLMLIELSGSLEEEAA